MDETPRLHKNHWELTSTRQGELVFPWGENTSNTKWTQILFLFIYLFGYKTIISKEKEVMNLRRRGKMGGIGEGRRKKGNDVIVF